MRRTKMVIPALVEVVFDTFYLSTVLFLGIFLCFTGDTSTQRLYGSMALLLGGGDAFHLIPRMGRMISGVPKKFQTALGVGKMITSITMTIFYLILWQIGIALLKPEGFPLGTGIILTLSILRIGLCLFPQNQWTSATPPLSWGIYRNIPFFLLGLMVMVFFAVNANALPASMRFLWLAVFLSFLCYLPVVLFTHKNPKVGMLMLPKSCAYLWIVFMGLGL